MTTNADDTIESEETTISTQLQPTTWQADRPSGSVESIYNWLARRRVAISLIGFTTLVGFNVVIKRAVPYSPFDLSSPWVLFAISLLLIGLAIRSWSAGTLNKSRELTMTGPYSLVRNPLYVGSFLMMVSFCILCRDIPTLLFIAGPLSVLYWAQVRFEERRLNNLFPEQWPNYARSTPRFFPRRIKSAVYEGWSRMEWMRNREYRAVAASLVGLLAIYGWYLLRTLG